MCAKAETCPLACPEAPGQASSLFHGDSEGVSVGWLCSAPGLVASQEPCLPPEPDSQEMSPEWQPEKPGHQPYTAAPLCEILVLWNTAEKELKDSTCPQVVSCNNLFLKL